MHKRRKGDGCAYRYLVCSMTKCDIINPFDLPTYCHLLSEDQEEVKDNRNMFDAQGDRETPAGLTEYLICSLSSF